jgi:hypothetical protein
MKWSTSKIGFDEEDHPTSTKGMGTIPLLCTPTINNIAINRTLIDGGAGLNIISIEVFEKMQVPYHRLMPTRPFFGVTEGSTMPIGQVRLPVTFGTRDNYRTESLDFDVAYIALPYNVISAIQLWRDSWWQRIMASMSSRFWAPTTRSPCAATRRMLSDLWSMSTMRPPPCSPLMKIC